MKSKVGIATDCQGKQPFPSKQAIFKIFTRPGYDRPAPYKCKQCGHYHIARPLNRPRTNRKALKRYLDERKKYFEGKNRV